MESAAAVELPGALVLRRRASSARLPAARSPRAPQPPPQPRRPPAAVPRLLWIAGAPGGCSGLFTRCSGGPDAALEHSSGGPAWSSGPPENRRWLYASRAGRWAVTPLRQAAAAGDGAARLVSGRHGGALPHQVDWLYDGDELPEILVLPMPRLLWVYLPEEHPARIHGGCYAALASASDPPRKGHPPPSWLGLPVWERTDGHRWLHVSPEGRWQVSANLVLAGRGVLATQGQHGGAMPHCLQDWLCPGRPAHTGCSVAEIPERLEITATPGTVSAEHAGRYLLARDPGVNGWPLWQREGGDERRNSQRWLFSTPQGYWRVTDDPSDFADGVGFIITRERHRGAMPHATPGGWRQPDGHDDPSVRCLEGDPCAPPDAPTARPVAVRRPATAGAAGGSLSASAVLAKRLARQQGPEAPVGCLMLTDARSGRKFASLMEQPWAEGGLDLAAPPGRRLVRPQLRARSARRPAPAERPDPMPHWERLKAMLRGPFCTALIEQRGRAAAGTARGGAFRDPATGEAELSPRSKRIEACGLDQEGKERYWLRYGRAPPPTPPPVGNPPLVRYAARDGEFPEASHAHPSTVAAALALGPPTATPATVRPPLGAAPRFLPHSPRHPPAPAPGPTRYCRPRRRSAGGARCAPTPAAAVVLPPPPARRRVCSSSAPESAWSAPPSSGGTIPECGLQHGQQVCFKDLIHHYRICQRKLRRRYAERGVRPAAFGPASVIEVAYAGRMVSVADHSQL